MVKVSFKVDLRFIAASMALSDKVNRGVSLFGSGFALELNVHFELAWDAIFRDKTILCDE